MAKKPSKASHSKSEAVQDLNLSPILALLVILIPMLLAMFNFFEVKVQAVAAPKLGTGKTTKADDSEKPLNLTVLVSKDGFLIKQQSELQDTADRPIPKDVFTTEVTDGDNVITTTGEDYDYPALYSKLHEKKSRYPKETTVNIAAEMDIPWHVIARTIDAARLKLEKPEYTGPNRMMEYSRAMPVMQQAKSDIDGDGKVDDNDQEPEEMFPRVVFVVAED